MTDLRSVVASETDKGQFGSFHRNQVAFADFAVRYQEGRTAHWTSGDVERA